MNDQEQSGEKKFKVTDRRFFTEEGDPREEDKTRSEGEKPPVVGSEEAPPKGAPTPRVGGKEEAKGTIDFSSFVLSMAGSAMMHMGEGPPGAPENQVNLPAAQQMIEILSMLQEKTKGNLSAEEDQLMQQLLFELQMTFVKKNKQ